MKIVLDVSAAFSIITDSTNSKTFKAYLEKADVVYAPDIYFSEAANTAWKYHSIKDATPDESLQMAVFAVELIDSFISSDILWKTALALSCKINHSVYNCLYLSIAIKEKATLLTNDKRLKALANDLKVFCV